MNLEYYSIAEFDRGRSRWVEMLWIMVQEAFIASWLPGSAYRCWLLRCFGAEIGSGVVIKPRVRIKFPWRLRIGEYSWIGEGVWIDNLAEVCIGSHCCISQEAYLCTGSHDWTRESFDLITRPIRVEDEAWVAAKAMVGPGVTMGRGAVLALGSVATRDLRRGWIHGGNPAAPLKPR